MVFAVLSSVLYSQTKKESIGGIAEVHKPLVDTGMLGKWPTIGFNKLSADGRYFIYAVKNQPLGKCTVVLKAIDGKWEKLFIENSGDFRGFISGDSKRLIFQREDTLLLQTLGSDSIDYIVNVKSYKIIQNKKCNWLAYQLKSADGLLVLTNMLGKETKRVDRVRSYTFDEINSRALIEQETDTGYNVHYLNLLSNSMTNIWSSKTQIVNNYSFDYGGTQLVFSVIGKMSQLPAAVWYYKEGLEKAQLAINRDSWGGDSSWIMDNIEFTKNGKYFLYKLVKSVNLLPTISNTIAAKVNVWSYKEVRTPPEQTYWASEKEELLGVVRVGSFKSLIVKTPDEKIVTGAGSITGDHIVLCDQIQYYNAAYWWNLNKKPTFYLVSLINGEKVTLKRECAKALGYFSFSDNGRWLIYWDFQKGVYFSYDIVSKRLVSLTKQLPTSLCVDYVRSVDPYPVSQVAAWPPGDSSVFLYDNYDIWEVSISANFKPVCLTGGYGRTHHVKLRILYEEKVREELREGRSIMLVGFNDQTKYNGFFEYSPGGVERLKLLCMGPYTYYRLDSQKPSSEGFSNGVPPEKAALSDAWLVQRQSASSPPNYYLTKDFNIFSQLTNLQPQKAVNWLVTKLINYKQVDGTQSQAVLYLPENFNPGKKYPIIFHFYEALSYRMYEFPYPGYSNGDLNIPWFVSNGYLVCTPDIHYTVAHKSGKVVGEYAYNSVVGAANYLSKLPYVDVRHMGIQGHSFGGLEAAYLATHTTIFAATAEAAGSTDPISAYLTLVPTFSPVEWCSKQEGIEINHELYGCTPWERPDLFRKNSAVLAADKANAPILIMHNLMDHQVQGRQGVEFFLALRRLHKKCWFLQYDNAYHTLKRNDAVDYTIRLTQFFDHYLKEKAAPRWMTQGVLASQKGFVTGFDLDPGGYCGVLSKKDCAICKKWNEELKMKELMTLLPKKGCFISETTLFIIYN